MPGSVLPEQPPDQQIDITRDICPMTFVRTRLALDKMAKGQVLLVRLQGHEPRLNIPRTVQEQGHTVLHVQDEPGGTAVMLIRKS